MGSQGEVNPQVSEWLAMISADVRNENRLPGPTVVEVWAIVDACEQLHCWGPETVFRALHWRLLAAYFEPQDTGKPQKKFLFLNLSWLSFSYFPLSFKAGIESRTPLSKRTS